jgi:hypothetical protein
MPGVSVKRLIDENFITAVQGQVLHEIRRYNPLLFGFVLKRHLVAEGTRFESSVFETAGFFVMPSKLLNTVIDPPLGEQPAAPALFLDR